MDVKNLRFLRVKLKKKKFLQLDVIDLAKRISWQERPEEKQIKFSAIESSQIDIEFIDPTSYITIKWNSKLEQK